MKQTTFIIFLTIILMFLASGCTSQMDPGVELMNSLGKLAPDTQAEIQFTEEKSGNSVVAENIQPSDEIVLGNGIGNNPISQAGNPVINLNASEGISGLENTPITDQSQAVSFTDGGTTVESSQADQIDASVMESNSGVESKAITSLEDRETMLEGVNLSPPIDKDGPLPGLNSAPAPGTESGPVELAKPVASNTLEQSHKNKSSTTADTLDWSIKTLSEWLSSWIKYFLSN